MRSSLRFFGVLACALLSCVRLVDNGLTESAPGGAGGARGDTALPGGHEENAGGPSSDAEAGATNGRAKGGAAGAPVIAGGAGGRADGEGPAGAGGGAAVPAGAGGTSVSNGDGGESGACDVTPLEAGTLEIQLEADLVLQQEATATVILYGENARLADGSPSVIAQSEAAVSSLPALVRLDVPANPARLVADCFGSDGVQYYLAAELDVDQDGNRCTGDYFGGTAAAATPYAVQESVALQRSDDWYECGTELTVELSSEAAAALSDVSRVRVMLGAQRVDGGLHPSFELVVDEKATLSELPGILTVPIPPRVHELLGYDPDDWDAAYPNYTLEVTVDADGDGRLCPGDLAAGPDPIQLFDEELSVAVVLQEIAADQACETFAGTE
jgi:hypothetical protein